MRHRILLIGGTVVERGRLEGSLRNVGLSALPAADAASATLLCRQFGPTAVLLLDDPELMRDETLRKVVTETPYKEAVTEAWLR